jgi:hypothetical protein
MPTFDKLFICRLSLSWSVYAVFFQSLQACVRKIASLTRDYAIKIIVPAT